MLMEATRHLPQDMLPFAERLFTWFPEVLATLGSPTLCDLYELPPMPSVQMRLEETGDYKIVHIKLPRRTRRRHADHECVSPFSRSRALMAGRGSSRSSTSNRRSRRSGSAASGEPKTSGDRLGLPEAVGAPGGERISLRQPARHQPEEPAGDAGDPGDRLVPRRGARRPQEPGDGACASVHAPPAAAPRASAPAAVPGPAASARQAPASGAGRPLQEEVAAAPRPQQEEVAEAPRPQQEEVAPSQHLRSCLRRCRTVGDARFMPQGESQAERLSLSDIEPSAALRRLPETVQRRRTTSFRPSGGHDPGSPMLSSPGSHNPWADFRPEPGAASTASAQKAAAAPQKTAADVERHDLAAAPEASSPAYPTGEGCSGRQELAPEPPAEAAAPEATDPDVGLARASPACGLGAAGQAPDVKQRSISLPVEALGSNGPDQHGTRKMMHKAASFDDDSSDNREASLPPCPFRRSCSDSSGSPRPQPTDVPWVRLPSEALGHAATDDELTAEGKSLRKHRSLPIDMPQALGHAATDDELTAEGKSLRTRRGLTIDMPQARWGAGTSSPKNGYASDGALKAPNLLLPPVLCERDVGKKKQVPKSVIHPFPGAFPNQRSLIIFDWDDTLCPTSWIRSILKDHISDEFDWAIGAESDSSHRVADWEEHIPPWFWQPLPDTPHIRDLMAQLQSAVINVIEVAQSLGIVCIVTNAEQNWVDKTMQKWLPALRQYVLGHGARPPIRVIYGQQRYTRPPPGSAAAKLPWVDRIGELTWWKKAAMYHALVHVDDLYRVERDGALSPPDSPVRRTMKNQAAAAALRDEAASSSPPLPTPPEPAKAPAAGLPKAPAAAKRRQPCVGWQADSGAKGLLSVVSIGDSEAEMQASDLAAFVYASGSLPSGAPSSRRRRPLSAPAGRRLQCRGMAWVKNLKLAEGPDANTILEQLNLLAKILPQVVAARSHFRLEPAGLSELLAAPDNEIRLERSLRIQTA